MDVITLATAWGPRFGGINAFNYDIAIGLAGQLRGQGRVFCAVPNAREEEVGRAAQIGVELLPLQDASVSDSFDPNWVSAVRDGLVRAGRLPRDILWVGHDLISGKGARTGVALTGGNLALIHHMSYRDYYSVSHDDDVAAQRKTDAQRELFQGNDAHYFGVGPLLTKRCSDLCGTTATMIVPGFPAKLQPRRSSQNSIVAMMVGRLDAQQDRIKQAALVAAAFGRCSKAAQSDQAPAALRNAELVLIGATSIKTERQRLLEVAEERSERLLKVQILPFEEDRDELFKRIAGANVAFMLSWHEGFGLVGWEAIAHGIPIIVGKNTGLFELISELGGRATGCVKAIDVRGSRAAENFAIADEEIVAEALRSIATDIPRAIRDADELKKQLVTTFGCTWAHAARTILEQVSRTGENASGIRSSPPTVPPLRHLRAEPPENRVPACVQLSISPVQGDSEQSFHLLPELIFGRHTQEKEGLVVDIGLREATVYITVSGCETIPGSMLDQDDSRYQIRLEAGGKWRVTGVLDSYGVLTGRALGKNALCTLGTKSSQEAASIELHVSFSTRDMRICLSHEDNNASIMKTKMAQAYLAKCLFDEKMLYVASSVKLFWEA